MLGPPSVVPVADARGLQFRRPRGANLAFWLSEKERRATWTAEPFVAVCHVEVGCQSLHVQRDRAGSVSTVDQGEHTASAQRRDNLLERQDHGRRAGDVIDNRQSCPRGDSAQNAIGDLTGRRHGNRDPGGRYSSPGLVGNVLGGIGDSVVAMVRDQDFVARLKKQYGDEVQFDKKYAKQKQIEADDTISFEEYLQNYFNEE